ncbi:MAG: cytidylyltransferase domain-containing protein [Bdellovibrionota bacterium]
MSKTGLIIQARLGSNRLPEKILKHIQGKPVLELFLERAKRITGLDEIIIATTDQSEDDQILEFCKKMNLPCFRGSTADVLDRFFQASKQFKLDHILRITSDCPLFDPQLSSEVVAFYHQNPKLDQASNNSSHLYPHGLDTEIFSFDALQKAALEAKASFEREHVTPFIRDLKNSFQLGQAPQSLPSKIYSHYRWTLDYPEDFEFIKRIYDELYLQKPEFTSMDIIELISQKPELLKINEMRIQKF